MGELVVEVVVALAVGQEGEPAVVARAVLVAVRLAAEGVRGGVDEEREVVADDEAQHAREQEHAPQVAMQPAERQRQAARSCRARSAGNSGAGTRGSGPSAGRAPFEVRLAARLAAQHPADVREPEAAAGGVGVAVVVVHVLVVAAVVRGPVQDAVLQRHARRSSM